MTEENEIIYWSKSESGFYDPEIHFTMPPDVVEITKQERNFLINSQSNGKLIKSNSDGYPILVDPPKQTKEEISGIITAEIQKRLDAGAREWGYNDLATATTYAASTNKEYSADAISLIKWRDDVWTWAFPLLKNVTQEESPENFLKSMPELPEKFKNVTQEDSPLEVNNPKKANKKGIK